MTYKAPHIERRLRAYGEFMRAPIALTTGVTCTLAQVVEMGPNMGSGSSGGEPSDGGHLMRYYRHRKDTGEAIAADEVHQAVNNMRHEQWRQLVRVTWVDFPRGGEPRSERVAAEMMGISRNDYCLVRAAMFGYLENELYSPRAVFEFAADDDEHEQAA